MIIVTPSNAKIIIVQPQPPAMLHKELLKTIQLLWGPKEKEKTMKFYKLTCHTPFVGEEADYYLRAFTKEELHRQVDECVYDNGSDWYDQQTLDECDMSEDDYYAECGVTSLIEIDAEEYYKHCPWDKPKGE